MTPSATRRDDRIARDLRRAAITTSAQIGYSQVTVGDLMRVAGISRATFYARYDSKEKCALAAGGEVAGTTIARLGAAGPRARQYPAVEEVIARACGGVAVRPDEARFLLLELPAIGPEGVALRERMRDLLAALIGGALTPGGRSPERELVGRAIVGALERISITRLERGEPEVLIDAADALVAWAARYRDSLDWLRAPAAGGAVPIRTGVAGAPAPGSLATADPRPRARILDAVTRITARAGYRALTTRAVAKEAAVSLRTLYTRFDSLDHAVDEALQSGVAAALDMARTAAAGEPNPDQKVLAAANGLAWFLAGEPAFAQLVLVEAPRLGSAGVAAQHRAITSLSHDLARTLDRPRADIAVEASACASFEFCAHLIATGRVRELPRWGRWLGLMALLPLAGSERTFEAAASLALAQA